MRTPVELRCIACPLAFCCAKCRRAHERNVHRLHYECPICRHDKFLCSSENLQNEHLIKHLVDEHLPLHCNRCGKIFENMTDFKSSNKCHTIQEEAGDSENEVTTNIINEEKEIEERFNSLYDKISADLEVDCGENFEAIVSINKTNKTATITPLLHKNGISDRSTSEEDDEINDHTKHCVPTPHPKAQRPRVKRTDTPHIKKVLMRQMAEDIEDDCSCDNEKEGKTEVKQEITKEPDEISGVQLLQESDNSKTPSRVFDSEKADPEVRTPISQTLKVDNLATLASAVTTSTPTHPASQWALFPEPGADSPLSEIEGTADTASPGQQSSLNESSKGYMDSNPSKSEPKKLKSIIIIGGRSRIEGQDSSEKQVTFADSVSTDSSISRTKKVKFADDTKFDDAKPKRVFRRPKRMLTPGPQRMRKITNPHFQAILNRFENQQGTLARTPIYKRDDQQQCSELTPALAELANMPARAIHFKDESPTIEDNLAVDSPANELFKSCMESPDIQPNAMDVAITTFSSNIAGSIQTCLTSALQTSDDATEIQFKFVITKKRVSVRRIVDDGKIIDEKTGEFDRQSSDKTNIWRTITKAVKNVFWSRNDDKENLASATTPLTFSRAKGSLELYTSASKRKCEEIPDSDISPLNHKRYKYGRIRGRRPISRMLNREVSGLKMSHSAEQHNLINQLSQCKEHDQINQSF